MSTTTSALRQSFQKTQSLHVSTTLSALFAELNMLDIELSRDESTQRHQALMMRRAQLLSLIRELEAEQRKGREFVQKTENDQFAIAAALTYIALARQPAQRAIINLHAQNENKPRVRPAFRFPAPRFAA